ncbi:uncharacterized protein LOC119676355 [Teleopsis dalmanni]|uniref:uncharacterized protein LOC119676355 n=1 Tax=Teleopsis dalmanni TaxID=139649 RepID=UPI0018CDA928|nr:uncharacterized protein LOC119676355 [Teleopsis dalmanni]
MNIQVSTYGVNIKILPVFVESAGLGNTDPINTNHANRTVYYTGSEANIVKTFCQVRNCHLRVEPYGVDDWGAIYDNETATGNLGGIYAQHIELAIGCFYNWYNNITETSGTIARSAVTLLGPAPSLHPAWRTNIMPFSNKLWVFLLCTLSLCSFLMYFIKFSNHSFKHSKNRVFRHMNVLEHSVLNIFAIFIQQPYAHTGLHYISIRVFLTALLCAALTLENIYSGQLKSILTIPFYSEPIDTTYKWSQINWKWAAPAVIWVKTIENSDLVKEQVLTKNFETRNYDFLYNASFRNDYGIGIERLMSGSFSFSDFLTTAALDNKIVLKDDLYFDWTRAISIRGWPLMPLFNEHILICIETGLFIHWEKEAAEQYLNRQVQDMMFKLASGHINKVPPRKLTVENISAALFALGFGYLIAAIVLLLEIFTSKLTQSSNEIKKKATLKRKQRMLNKKLQS